MTAAMADNAAPQLAAYVRTLRLRAGLTQEDLAERAGVTVDTIGALERGLRRRLYPHTARALADALDLQQAEREQLADLAHGRSRAQGAQPVAPGTIPPAATRVPSGDRAWAVSQREAGATGAAVSRQEVPRPLHNLPAVLTRLIGRERELAQIQDQLAHTRLLTLTGAGGIGKTRLALEAARMQRPRFRDGVWLAELAPLTDPSLVLSAVAGALGVGESPGRPLLATLTESLRERQLLLVLDNFEQVLDAATDIAALLSACPLVSVLATSRAPLHVSGEHELLVPPLRTPLESRNEAVEAVAYYAAVQLFVERAVAVKAEFVLTQDNSAAVVAICARLDGLPLAIELAAARVKLFTPQALLTRLDQRLQLLTGGPQDRPSRQRTLRAAIAWSYDLLSEPEQALFRRLGVFVGGFTFTAAAAVCSEGSPDSVDLIDAIAALVDKSLLQQDDSAAAEHGLSLTGEQPAEQEPRFAMFETIREFALEQLGIRDELARWSGRHVDHFLSLMEQSEVDLRETAPVSTAWHTRRQLSPEHGNFRAALAWTCSQGESENALRLAGAVCALWVPALNLTVAQRWLDQSAGTLREARAWLEQCLTLDPPASDAVRAKAMYGLGRVLHFQWDEWDQRQAELDHAIRVFEESLAIYRRLDDRRGIIRCLVDMGWALWEHLEHDSGVAVFEESLSLSRIEDDAVNAGWSLIGLGRVAMWTGNSEHAGPFLEDGLAEQRRAGNQLGVAAALDALGLFHQSTHDYSRALECFEEAVALRRGVGAESGLPPALQRLGAAVAGTGDLRRGVALIGESLVLSRRMGSHPSDAAIGLISIGAMAGGLGLLESGARLCGAGEALFEARGLDIPSAFIGVYRRSVAGVRRAFGDEAFEAAFTAGRALPLQQAIDEAMQVAAEVARDRPPA